MAVKTFTTGEVLTAADTNTYLANAGLVHIKTATVTNAADSGTAFRSIFNTTYDSYRIVCHTLLAHTNGSAPRMSFYYSTSTEQTTGYYSSVVNASYLGTSSITAVNNNAYIQLSTACDNIGSSGFSVDILQVGYSARGQALIQFNDAFNANFSSGGGIATVTRTYDGVRFFMSAGNISMTASVYGYRKA